MRRMMTTMMTTVRLETWKLFNLTESSKVEQEEAK
jgi:hypothetical protein